MCAVAWCGLRRLQQSAPAVGHRSAQLHGTSSCGHLRPVPQDVGSLTHADHLPGACRYSLEMRLPEQSMQAATDLVVQSCPQAQVRQQSSYRLSLSIPQQVSLLLGLLCSPLSAACCATFWQF